MEHVRADFGGGVHVHVFDQHVLAVDDFPVARKHEIVAQPVDQRNDRPPLRERRHGTALKAVAAVHDQRALGVFMPQRVEHRAKRRQPAAPFERRFSVLVEELVVDIELCVDVRGVQDGQVFGLPGLHRPASGQVVHGRALHAGRQHRTNPEAHSHRTDLLQELTAAAHAGCHDYRELWRNDMTFAIAARACARIAHASTSPSVVRGRTAHRPRRAGLAAAR